MSKGIVHTRASLFLAGTLVLVTINHGGGYELALGPVIGVMISPDQDVDNGNVSNTYIRSIPFVGRYLDLAWDALWFFYRKSLKHGSELSHFPVVSTLGRIAYLYLFLIVLPYVALGTVLPGAWNIPHELTW